MFWPVATSSASSITQIKISSRLATANVEDVHQSVVLARDRLEFHDALKFPAKGMFMPGAFFIHDFDGAVSSQNVPGQPHLAAAAAANEPDELMIRNDRRD